MLLGIDLAQRSIPWAEVASRARFAEDLGFDCAWGFDHLAAVPDSPRGETFEGMTMLAALSGVTSRIRLGLLVTAVTHRHPSLLAAQALTVDHASGGRLNLALGAGWDEDEHRALGLPFPDAATRFDMLADTVEILSRLYCGEFVSYSGAVVSLRAARMFPRPLQSPKPPIWIGGTGPRRTLPLTAWYADAWHAYGTPESLGPYARRLDVLAQAAGRQPSDILRASTISIDGPIDNVRHMVSAWEEAGWGYLVCAWPDGGRSVLESFAAVFL